LEIWNAGELPPPLKPEDLHGPHSSVLRNPLLAQTFYFAGLVERWGTGTVRIIELCRAQGLPEPDFQNQQGGFLVTFFKDPYVPERLRQMGLTERQLQIIAVLRRAGSVSVGDLHRLFPDVSSKTIQRDLQALVNKGLLKALGAKKGRRYVLA